jgi:hypothetical protein
MDDGMLIGLIIPLGAFAMVVLIVLMLHLARKHKIREQVGLQRHFLDKFNSGQELTQFLETPQGQRFVKELAVRDTIRSPKERILRSIKSGILLLALGSAFLLLMRLEKDMIYGAIILLALGIGFLISSAISYWLSKKWGVFQEGDILLDKGAGLKT